jgi:galactokinase
LSDAFTHRFGRRADVCASAPGRVNLIGEHTDYNGGYVLPMALAHQTHVQIARRSDDLVRGSSADVASSDLVEFQLSQEQRLNGWIDYVQGVTWALAERGHRVRGFDLLVSSTVPIGKGLSSSASLEVAMCRALRDLYDLPLTDLDIATTSHRAEAGFVGAPVGIMDQMVCSLGDAATALFIDASTGRYERIVLPPDVELGVIDSGIAHHHASGDYRIRRRECEAAARELGVTQLGELSPADLPRIAQLPDPLIKRARHVITENTRVLSAVTAIRRGDTLTLGRLFFESHVSMRDDFDISLPPIDRLVSLAEEDSRVIGARLTGGGFGGAVVVVCRAGEAGAATLDLVARYRTITHLPAVALVP